MSEKITPKTVFNTFSFCLKFLFIVSISGAVLICRADVQEKCLQTSATGSDLSALRYCRAAAEDQKNHNFSVFMAYAEILKKPVNRMPPKLDLAEKSYMKAEAVDPENPASYFSLGILLYRQHRYDEALAQFRMAADLNHTDAICHSALMISKGQGTVSKPRESFELFKKAALGGEPRAQRALRDYYSLGTPELNIKESYFWALAASENGDYLASSNIDSISRRLSEQEQQIQQNRLAEWLETLGDSEKECIRLHEIKSMNAALGFCLRAVGKSKSPLVYEILGDLYMSETAGNPPDTARAVQWYQRASAAGSINASYKIGSIYNQQMRGLTAAESQKRAFEYFSQAAAGNHQNAALMVGIAYETGRGILKNRNEAIRWYRKAALAGNEEAAYRLGSMLNDGGEYRDAVFWLSIANLWGYRTAEAKLKSVQRKLSSSKMKETSAEVQKFISDDLK